LERVATGARGGDRARSERGPGRDGDAPYEEAKGLAGSAASALC